MSEKRMVRRSVAIALGVVCIILIAGIVEIRLYYLVQDIEKDETITRLNIEAFNKNSQISQLKSNVTNLQNQVNNLTDILNLNKSAVWYNGTLLIVPPLELTMLEKNAPYAEYVSVQVSSPQGNETIILLIYYSEVLKYRHEDSINLGSNGTAISLCCLQAWLSIFL